MKPHETLDFKMNKQMLTFSFNPPINLSEERKLLLAVTSFEATNCIFNITGENNSFSIRIPNHWTSELVEEIINKMNKISELICEKDIELHVKEVEKKGTRIEIKNIGYNLAGFDPFKTEILLELKRIKYRHLEGMVFRLQLTYDEIIDILDVKYISGSTIGYTLPPGVYEISDINLMLKSLLHGKAKLKTTIDVRLKSNLKNNETIRFIKKSFLILF